MYKLSTERLHGNHVLRAGERKLDDLQQGFTDSLQRADTGGERQQEDVPPGDEEGDWPAEEYEDEEPENPPQYAGTQSTSTLSVTLSFTLTHSRLAERSFKRSV